MKLALAKLSLAAALLALSPLVAGASQSSVVSIVVRDLPVEEILPRIIAKCAQDGAMVQESNAYQVICSKPMDDSFKSMFIRALLTPSNSTNPVHYYRLTAVRNGHETTVSADEYVQYQNAYGQTTTIPLNNKKQLAAVRAGLEHMKSNWEQKLASSSDQLGETPSTTTTPEAGRFIAPDNGSMQPALQALAALQCSTDFTTVGVNGTKTLFSGRCADGSRQIVECAGMTCKALK